MASQSLKDIVDFALTDSGSQIRVENERKHLNDYKSGARHLNDIFTEWLSVGCLVPGFHRKAFVIPETRSVFTLGVNADLPTGAAVKKVNQVTLRTDSNFTRMLKKVEVDEVIPSGYDRNTYYFGIGLGVYGVSFDGDFVRFVFPCNLQRGDVLIVDYRSELGAVDVNNLTMNDLSNIFINLPSEYLLALRYGVAAKLAKQYGSPTRQSLMRDYEHKLNLILMVNQDQHFVNYDSAILKTGSFYLRQSDTPLTEIGGMYQSDGTVVIVEDHPNHPDYSDGTLHFGFISMANADTQTGSLVFRYGVLLDVQTTAPTANDEYMYLEVPQGSEITSIIDERGVDVIRGWTRTGQQWRLGPLGAFSVGQTRRYRVLVRQS